MELLTPGIGLIFWQTVTFSIVVIILGRFVWKPILSSLKAREKFIDESLKSAESARNELTKLKSDNEALLKEARNERDKMLKEAVAAANKIKESAKEETIKIADKMIADARNSIENEKKTAIAEVRAMAAQLSIEIAGKILKKNLTTDDSQKQYVEDLLKDIKVN